MSIRFRLAKTFEIPEGRPKTFNVNGYNVLIVNFQGKFYAVEDRCTHMGYPLYLGSINGRVITCGFHYAKFDVTTGEALSPPAHKSLKTYNVIVEDSNVILEL
jgi:nitrite reductase/ring-hydroxylating ferredoxin subunit